MTKQDRPIEEIRGRYILRTLNHSDGRRDKTRYNDLETALRAAGWMSHVPSSEAIITVHDSLTNELLYSNERTKP